MPTAKQIQAAKKTSENIRSPKPKSQGEILREVGYSESVSESPTIVTESKGFQELMDDYLPDDEVMKVHQQLLQSTKIEHMIFPVYTGVDDLIPEEGDIPEELEERYNHGTTQGSSLSDKDIEEMLAEVNCKVRRIVHGDTARHVYFWSPDANARKAAVELAYKIKGRITNKVKLDAEIRNTAFADLTAEELRKLASSDEQK